MLSLLFPYLLHGLPSGQDAGFCLGHVGVLAQCDVAIRKLKTLLQGILVLKQENTGKPDGESVLNQLVKLALA